MPIYEYECNACGGRHEIIQKMSDPRLTDCPACGAGELKKLISRSGFRLAGGGWYETDFKSGDSRRNIADKGGSEKQARAQGTDSSGSQDSNKSGDSGQSKGAGKSDQATGNKAAASDG